MTNLNDILLQIAARHPELVMLQAGLLLVNANCKPELSISAMAPRRDARFRVIAGTTRISGEGDSTEAALAEFERSLHFHKTGKLPSDEPQQSEPKATSQKTRTPVQDRLLLAAHEAGEFGLPVGKDVSSRGCVVRYPAPAVDALERCGLVETFLGSTGGRWFKITKLGQSEATNLQSAA